MENLKILQNENLEFLNDNDNSDNSNLSQMLNCINLTNTINTNDPNNIKSKDFKTIYVNFVNSVNIFLKKNIREKENILNSIENLIYGLIKLVDYLEDIFKFSIEFLQKEKNLVFNLKNILANELWDYIIKDDLVFLLIKLYKNDENTSERLREYINYIENIFKSTIQQYLEIKLFFKINCSSSDSESNKNEFNVKSERKNSNNGQINYKNKLGEEEKKEIIIIKKNSDEKNNIM